MYDSKRSQYKEFLFICTTRKRACIWKGPRDHLVTRVLRKQQSDIVEYKSKDNLSAKDIQYTSYHISKENLYSSRFKQFKMIRILFVFIVIYLGSKYCNVETKKTSRK